jgi:hypothetical protein
MPIRLTAIILGLILALAPIIAPARSGVPVRLGILTCQVDGGIGKIISSRRELSCIFEDANGQPFERYAGEIRRYGLDIGSTSYSDIGWAVFALADADVRPGVLQGSYAGLSAGASIGIGLGANVLVGGFGRSFALQPLSLETSRGLNLAIGVAQLELIGVGTFE